MTNDECRAEALKRVQESDRLFERWRNEPDPALYSEIRRPGLVHVWKARLTDVREVDLMPATTVRASLREREPPVGSSEVSDGR
jgi:hypothetical protein